MNSSAVEKNLRVLLIDDNQAIHEDFRKIFVPASRAGARFPAAAAALFGETAPVKPGLGFELDSAFQGKEGVECVRRACAAGRPYALAFVDLRMPPGWDGIETIVALWAIDPDVQVVICTAYSDYVWEEIVQVLGQSDRLLILKKPFDNVEVLQMASALTEKWRVTQQARATIGDLEVMVDRRSSELRAALARANESLAERERTEIALRASEDKFSKVFRTHPDAISISRLRDNRVIEVNPGFCRLTGYAANEVTGRSPLPADLGIWTSLQDYERILAGVQPGGDATALEMNLRRRDGAILHCMVSASLMDLGGDVCLLAITRDLTAHKRLEERLANAGKMEAIGQLAGGVAHDYNNILTATLLHLEMLLSSAEMTPDLETALHELQAMANRSAGLTRQLLAFSRRQVVQFRTVDLNKVVHELLRMLHRLLGENMCLAFHPTEEPLWIEADPGMIEQIVTNLCVNARDAMQPAGGRMEIATSRVVVPADIAARNPEAAPGKFVCLVVRDTGCGIDAALLPRLFEPFFTTKEVGKGTGLGLATVYGIAKQHHGWVEVQSEVGRGSTFQVFFPVATQVQAPIHEAADLVATRGSETILIVEDEERVRHALNRTLQASGYRVLQAADGPEAMRIWGRSSKEIALLLSDMVMPNGITGLDLAERFRQERPDLKVIIASGYSVELRKSGVPTGPGFAYLAKPFDVSQVCATVRACLDGD